jgi:hypothetical protein
MDEVNINGFKINKKSSHKAGGGNSWKWMSAYKALMNKRETLTSLPKEVIDEKMEYFIKGYEEACKVFETNAKPIVSAETIHDAEVFTEI